MACDAGWDLTELHSAPCRRSGSQAEHGAGGKRVALIDAAEYEGLLETAHLLRSPRNAERLWLALDQARRGEGLEMSVEELRREALGGEGDR